MRCKAPNEQPPLYADFGPSSRSAADFRPEIDVLVDILIGARSSGNRPFNGPQRRETGYNPPFPTRPERPDERLSELAYRRRLVRQLQLCGSLPVHLCPGAGSWLLRVGAV